DLLCRLEGVKGLEGMVEDSLKGGKGFREFHPGALLGGDQGDLRLRMAQEKPHQLDPRVTGGPDDADVDHAFNLLCGGCPMKGENLFGHSRRPVMHKSWTLCWRT